MLDPAKKFDQDDPRIICFENREDDRIFEGSLTHLMRHMQERSRDMFINKENILRMNHGGTWVRSASDIDPDTSMHTISASWTIPFKEIADNDLSVISRTIVPISESMEAQFAHSIYGVVGAAAEKVGNVVDTRASGSFSHAMLEMFRKIEIGVDRDGNISMPQMHVGPDLYKRLAEELANVPPELEAEIERVKGEKVETAFRREAERKAKFKRSAE